MLSRQAALVRGTRREETGRAIRRHRVALKKKEEQRRHWCIQLAVWSGATENEPPPVR
jgi:hypothetical protein